MSFFIKNSEVWKKYEEIWNVIKNKLNIKFHSQPIYENKYLKVKVRVFGGNIKTNFLGNGLPKENTYYTCIACITADSVLKMKKKLSSSLFRRMQVQSKKIHTPRFINIELEPDSDSDAEIDLESNATTDN